jgi:hypothetical protein
VQELRLMLRPSIQIVKKHYQRKVISVDFETGVTWKIRPLEKFKGEGDREGLRQLRVMLAIPMLRCLALPH